MRVVRETGNKRQGTQDTKTLTGITGIKIRKRLPYPYRNNITRREPLNHLVHDFTRLHNCKKILQSPKPHLVELKAVINIDTRKQQLTDYYPTYHHIIVD